MASTDWPLVLQLIIVAAILIYGVLVVRFVPSRYSWIPNIIAAGITIGAGLWLGLSLDAMGLAPGRLIHGLTLGLLVGMGVYIAVLAASRTRWLKPHFTNTPFARMSRRHLGTEVAMRIPLGTALLEEVLFRGLLLGLFMQFHVTWAALLFMAVSFGLWHLSGEVRKIETQHGVQQLFSRAAGRQWALALGVIVATALAGLVFGLLRLISGSILTPWLAHWAINASGALASRGRGSSGPS